MDQRVWICLVLALVAAAPALAQAQDQGTSAPPGVPWWGPESFDDGWTLRVPVVVENTWGYPVDNAPVRVDLDIGSLARQAGWTAGQVGSEELLKSFTLQPESTRVVSYTNFQLPRAAPSDASLKVASEDLGGTDKYTTPARVLTSFLKHTPPGPYDPTSNPILSVRWVANGEIQPGDTRHYMIYLEVEEHGPQQAQDEARIYNALGDRHWISRGHQIFGSGTHATVTGSADGTQVAVYTYDESRPTLADLDGENPFTIDAQEQRTVFLSADHTPFRVVASAPVVATGQEPPSSENRREVDMGFIPSMDGSIRGTEFQAAVYPGEYYVYATSPAGAGGRVNGQTFHTEGDITKIQVGGTLRLSVDNPVMVQGELGQRIHQFATLSGAPVGNHLVGSYHGIRTVNTIVHDAGGVDVRTLGGEAHVVGRSNDNNPRQIIPTSASATTLPVPVDDRAFAEGRDSWGFVPVDIQAVDPSDPTRPDESARLVAFGGMPSEEISSPIGGEWARRFVGPTDAHVFAFYDRTRIEATEGNGDTRVTVLQEGRRLDLTGSVTSPFHLETSKPVAVVPTDGAAFGSGRLDSLSVQKGDLQYRGHLISLAPEGDAQEPVVETTTFGEPITYELVVENRGRATDGGNLPDTVHLSHSPVPPGWNVTLDTRSLDLDTAENRTVTITVRPPETRDEGTRLKLEVRATSKGNPNVEVGVQLVTLLRQRREVGMWYEEVNGPQSLTTRLDPGEEREIPVLVQNLGSGPDAISLTRTGGQVGWTTSLASQGEEVDEVSLQADELRELDLVVKAPPRGSLALPTSFSITAASTNDTTATDKVLFEGIVLAKSKIALDTPDDLLQARPGETIVFPLTLSNDGNASADVQLNASLSAPDNWASPVFLHRGESLAPVDNRLTSVPPTGDDPVNLRFQLPVPDDASGRRSIKVLVTARTSQGSSGSTITLPLNVFVEPVVDVETSTPVETVIPPGRTSNWTLTLHNAGNVNATLTVLPEDVPPGWHLDHPSIVQLAENDTRTITGSLTVPAGAPPTNTTVALELGYPNGTRTSAAIPVHVPRWRTLDLDPPGASTIVPGVETTLDVGVHNAGNRPTPVEVDVDAPAGWTVNTAGSTRLEPLEHGTLHVRVAPPRDVGEATTNLTLTSTVDRGPSLPGVPPPVSAALEVRTRIPDLAILNATGGELGPDRAFAARGTITNTGDAVVENVTVGLLQGETVVANTTLSRVPPGSPRSAVVQLPDDGPQDIADLSLVVDPDDRIPETDEGNNRATLGAATSVGTPSVGTLVLLTLSGITALLVPRKDRR